jgi:hypothetical protein
MSTRPVAPEEIPEGWEKINQFAFRMVVPGGWIYDITGRGILFVPDPVRGIDLDELLAEYDAREAAGLHLSQCKAS